MKATVIKSYRAAYPEPFNLKKGDRVKLGKTDPDNPGWIWCTNQNGASRWVPESILDIDSEIGIIKKDYSSIELTVEAGDMLEILEKDSGWCFCQTDLEDKGWIPMANLKFNKLN
ncbi:MAG: SH3 domain-containing protein [Candidatus Zixiibacteriota bacterium]